MRAGSLIILVLACAFGSVARAQENERPSTEPARAPARDERRSPPAEAPPWRWPGWLVYEVEWRVSFPPQTAFDVAMLALGYDDVRVMTCVASGLSFPVAAEWFWLGGQIGVRGRAWDHREGNDASLVGIDLLANVRVRFLLGDRFELGATLGGGLGFILLTVNGVTIDQAVPRVSGQVDAAFPIGHHFAFGPRIGWDYFQWSPVNSYGHGVDAGGFYLALGLEGRE